MAPDDGIEYIRELSRMVELCASTVHGSPLRDNAARMLETRSRRRSLAVETDGEALRVQGGNLVPYDVPGTETLVSSLLSHNVGRLAIRQLTPAREFIEVAQILARPASDPQGGTTIEGELDALRLWNVEIIGVGSLDSTVLTDVLPPELIGGLRDGADYAHAEATLAKLATHGEQAVEQGDARVVGAVLVAMDAFERSTTHDDLRHTCGLALKRLLTPMGLRLAAQLLPSARRRESILNVLARDADVGAEALFAHLCASQELHERRAYFDSIVELGVGAEVLLQALEHKEWYVARNAAELLGEMRVDGAEASLTVMLRSPEARRRVAAASALARLRTTEALAALHRVRYDESAQVRYFASSAVIAQIEGASAQQLGRALEEGADPEVKLQIIGALGRLGTPDAVQKLIKTLVSGDALMRDGPALTAEFRCASIEAVAAARGASALSMIRQYRNDRDPRVRETAARVYAQLGG
jgi:HEAT repeat protein